MEILIITDGTASGSSVSINGEKQELAEFNFSQIGGQKPKMQMVKRVGNKTYPISMFAGDFAKYDEYNAEK